MTSCLKCYQKIDNEHIIVPIRDISFLVLNLQMCMGSLIDQELIKKDIKEKPIFDKLWRIYTPIIHYWSAGQYYTDRDITKTEPMITHRSYL